MNGVDVMLGLVQSDLNMIDIFSREEWGCLCDCKNRSSACANSCT
jgi:hypothetical protein